MGPHEMELYGHCGDWKKYYWKKYYQDLLSKQGSNQPLILALAIFVVKACARTTVEELTKLGTCTAAKCVVKVAWNPHAIASDFIQATLEYFGQRELGKQVGAVGNIGTSAVLGAMVGGPPGAAIGAITGGMLWLTGEVAGNHMKKWIG